MNADNSDVPSWVTKPDHYRHLGAAKYAAAVARNGERRNARQIVEEAKAADAAAAPPAEMLDYRTASVVVDMLTGLAAPILSFGVTPEEIYESHIRSLRDKMLTEVNGDLLLVMMLAAAVTQLAELKAARP